VVMVVVLALLYAFGEHTARVGRTSGG